MRISGMRASSSKTIFAGLGLAVFGSAPLFAADFSQDANYNRPFGMYQGQENQPVNTSLRDENGNLTVVNGQFTSSSMAQSGVGSAAVGAGFASASGLGSARTTAVGNALNVVTLGSGNTVVVNAQQTNTGNQTATINLNER